MTVEEQEQHTGAVSGRPFQLAILAAIGLGVLVRAVHVLSADFPLNDGGMFYTMVRDLQSAHYRLPAFRAYNSADIPFAYPPLAFYIAGVLDAVTPLHLLDIFRFLPLTIASLTVLAFFLLARSLLVSKQVVVAAVLAFAVLPSSFLWLIMGGGLTRAFGFLFAILTLHQVHRFYTGHEWRYVASATLLSGLTLLSHLGTTPFLAFSIVVFFLAFGRHQRGVIGSVMIALGTLAIAAPWWVTVAAQHGFHPFLAAKESSGSVLDIFKEYGTIRSFVIMLLRLTLGYTGEPFFPILLGLALMGALASLTRGWYLLPAWWAVLVVTEQRSAPLFVSVPMAMLVGVAVIHVFLPLLKHMRTREPRSSARLSPFSVSLLVLGLLLGYSTLGAVTPVKRSPSAMVAEGRALMNLTEGDRAAMQWVAAQTPRSSRFLVVTGNGWEIANVWAWKVGSGWPDDRISEWFPELAKRVSVVTVQGSEWLPNGEFDRRSAAYADAQRCANWGVACLDDWSQKTRATFTHIYVTKSPFAHLNPDYQCCGQLLGALAQDPRYARVYDGPGAVIYMRR